MPKSPLSRKCQHANVEQQIHRSTESLQVPLRWLPPHEDLGKPEPPALPQQLCWWKRIPLQTGGTGGMATSPPRTPWGSVWKENLPPCRGAYELSQGLPTKSQLVLVQSCSLWRGRLGRKERVTQKKEHTKIPSLLKVRDLHFTDGSIW